MRLLQVAAVIVIIVGIFNSLGATKYTSGQWVTLVFAGLAQGSIYALIALGYTLVYGILLMINFAHGDVYMAGAFTAVFLANSLAASGFLGAQPVISVLLLILLAASVSMVLNVVVERVAYRPLRGAPRLVPLITAIGASFTIEYTFRGLYGAEFQSYPIIPALDGQFLTLAGFEIPWTQIVVLVAAILLMVSLYFFIERTKIGKAMRAVSEDKEVARLMGIDVDKTIMITFAVGGALAGAAGVFNGIFRPQGVFFFMGFIPGIKAFTAAVLGGIGNIPGAMVGGLFLGVFEAIGPNLILEGLGIPAVNQLRDAFAFTILVLILIFRPQGIFGERLAEKKA
ncbi:MAG: branched-chain amino acid ABC transporter permease [Anaerolineales bacterium]|uniref:Branched-chain amino acid ABC transporter permease n=1 Tax=Candidatus Desulfolinea nitratireducens TaxID=2841698 RepID=A0A8J6TF11_9CHLR|nr:branched-chain amino acid ABC transporter permease [Candidatus Desulfolinea nitratireducens]MBL6959572.1 branched-chain amino acid ABC transporter permease [Anaerolineales bacterium]